MYAACEPELAPLMRSPYRYGAIDEVVHTPYMEDLKTKGAPMINATTLVNLEKSDDEKLLLKHGLVNSAGVLTLEGQSFLLQLLFKENRTKVLTAVVAIEEAQKKAAK